LAGAPRGRITDLSVQQEHILRWLLRLTQEAEQGDSNVLETGFQWGLKIADKRRENGRRASLGRTLRRLEGRGLIIRVKGRKKGRMVRVLLTPKGRRVAENISDY
jgi:DNA-binding MarR family transcriptional regulator